nr:hypothetical protein [Agrobacterium vitis]
MYLFEGLNGDQRIVMALKPADIVCLAANVTGVERLRQDIDNALLGDDTLSVAGEFREAFKKPPDFRLRLKAAHGITFEGITDDRRQRFVEHEHLSPAPHSLVFIADGRAVRPITGLHARFHLLCHLTAILLALKSTLGGHDGFDELAFRCLIELEVQAFDLRAPFPERLA